MSYVLRERNDADKEYFLKCGVKSPFGGIPGFGYEMVECIEDSIKMIFIGGQGYMKEDGEERSEMPRLSAFVWKDNSYILELYRHKKWNKNEGQSDKVNITYKIKAVYSKGCTCEEKEEFIEIAKKCLIAYGNGGSNTSVCESVDFMETEASWI